MNSLKNQMLINEIEIESNKAIIILEQHLKS